MTNAKIGIWDFYKDIPMMQVNDDANGNPRFMVDHKQFMPMGYKVNYRSYKTVFGDTFSNEVEASIYYGRNYGGKPIASAAFGAGIVFRVDNKETLYQYIQDFRDKQKNIQLDRESIG